MGLFNRGQSISGMWLDGKPAIRAYLGDVLVWDGTSPAFVNVPRALASALAVAPAVRADASITAVRTLGSSAAYAPSLTAFATVGPETAVIVTAQAGIPVVRADSLILVDVITVAAQALPAVAAQSSSAAVEVPSISVSASVPTPTVAAHFATTIPAIAVNASAQVPVITATGAAVVNVPVSAVNAMARVPAVSGNSSVVAFAVTADASAKIPTLTSSSAVSAVKATATALAPVPVVVANNFTASGMTKNASAQNWSGSSTFQVTGMVAESGSTLSGSALLPNGAKTGATVTAQVSISATNFMTSITAELRKNGTLVPGGTVTVSTSSTSTATLTIPTRTVDVVGTDQFTIWVTPGGASGGTVAAGVNTYVRIT